MPSGGGHLPRGPLRRLAPGLPCPWLAWLALGCRAPCLPDYYRRSRRGAVAPLVPSSDDRDALLGPEPPRPPVLTSAYTSVVLRPALLVLSVLAVFALLAFAARGAMAAAFDLKGDDWEGLAQLLRIAEIEVGSSRAIATTTLDLHRLTPADAVLLVRPTRSLDVDGLEAFLRAGGRVLLFDDYGTGDELMTRFRIERVPLPGRPSEMLRGNPALAIAEPGADSPAVHDVGRVVTNHAVGLQQPALSELLVVRGDGEPDVPLALAGSVGRGHLVAVGDASVFINAMLRYPGNRALALSLLRYAVEDDIWGKRGGKVYVVANDFDTVGFFGDESPVQAAVSELRRAVGGALDTLHREGMPPLAAYLAAVLVAGGVVVWTGARAGKTHRLATPRFARSIPVVAQGGVAGHAAVLGAPGTSRALAILELKSALEEELATRLGLQRAPPTDQIVARLRAVRLLDEAGAVALSRLFAAMTRLTQADGPATHPAQHPRGAFFRRSPSDAEVLRVAAEVRQMRLRLGLGAPERT
jgi:hypothetical protein